MRISKPFRTLSRSLTIAITALFVLSITPNTWSDETAPDAAPPATSDLSNEGVPPEPATNPGMGSGDMGSGMDTETSAEKPAKKKKSTKHSKKSNKHAKKKKKSSAKKNKKKKHHTNY